MDQPKPRIFIALPAYGNILSLQTALSIFNLLKTFQKEGIDWCATGMSFPSISEIRNIYATAFLDASDCTHILMIDSDMSFEPELVIDMIKFNEPLVGCLYLQKTYPKKYVVNGRPNPQEVRNGFLRVDGVGGGVLLIRHDCLDAMVSSGVALPDDKISKSGAINVMKDLGIKRVCRFFDPIEGADGMISEDLSLCKRWCDMGGKVWAAMDHHIVHVGVHGYGGKFSEDIKLVTDEPQAANA